MPLPYSFDPIRPFVDRPRCSNCGTQMWLDHIARSAESAPDVSTSKAWW